MGDTTTGSTPAIGAANALPAPSTAAPERPLFAARAVRIDVGSAPTLPTLDGLTFTSASTSASSRLLVIGAPRALFEAASGVIPVAHGELTVGGVSAREALARKLTAGAPVDPPMPPSWTVREYVTWSARLAGGSRRDANARASEAIARMQLQVLETARLERAQPHVRRATVLAAAFAALGHASSASSASFDPPTLLVEDPMSGLPDELARPFARIVLDAFEGVRVILFAGRTSLTSPLAAEIDEAIVLSGPNVVAQGAPNAIAGRTASYALKLAGDLDAFATFRDRAMLQGISFEADGARVVATLPEGVTTRDLLGLALESRAVVVELRPLSPGFV